MGGYEPDNSAKSLLCSARQQDAKPGHSSAQFGTQEQRRRLMLAYFIYLAAKGCVFSAAAAAEDGGGSPNQLPARSHLSREAPA